MAIFGNKKKTAFAKAVFFNVTYKKITGLK